MNPTILNIWQNFTGKLTEAANNVAASVSTQTDNVRDAASDVVAQVGAGASITAAAKIGSKGNVYTKIQAVGANWRTWAILGVCILIVFYFIVRKHKRA